MVKQTTKRRCYLKRFQQCYRLIWLICTTWNILPCTTGKYSPLYYSVKHWKYSWNICPNLSFCLLQCTPCRFHSDPIWQEANKSKIPLSRSSTSTYFFLTMWPHGMGVNIINKFCVDPYFFPLVVNEWLTGGRHKLWQAGNQLVRIFFNLWGFLKIFFD